MTFHLSGLLSLLLVAVLPASGIRVLEVKTDRRADAAGVEVGGDLDLEGNHGADGYHCLSPLPCEPARRTDHIRG